MEKTEDTIACLLLVPSFPQVAELEQQLHIFVAPTGKGYLCRATLPRRDSTRLLQAGMCPGHKMKYREKTLFVWWRWSNTGIGCLESLWSLHPWRYSNPSWTQLWRACCSCPCPEQGLGWMLSRDAFLPQLFCLLHGGVWILHLDCYMLMQNKYQCLRTPKHFTAFYFSVGTARNAMPMARGVINYPFLQHMLQGAKHMKRKTYTEDQTKTSDSNIPCNERTGVLCVWKPFSSKIKLLFVLQQKTGIKYQTFFFFLFLFNS